MECKKITKKCNYLNCISVDAKFRCCVCKRANYCSSECQKYDWSLHKLSCCRRIKSVVVNGENVYEREIGTNDLNKTDWIDCVVPSMLGIPLKVRRWSKNIIKPDKEVAMFLMIDPVHGFADSDWQSGVGKVEFAKADKTDFTIKEFWSLYSYIINLMNHYPLEMSYENFKSEFLVESAFKSFQLQEVQ